MNIKRLGVIVILGMMPVVCRAWAQEGYVSPATTALQEVLSNLKESVEKLSLDNDQLEARDNAVKQQILQLQAQLSQLEAQGDSLNKEADQLRDKNPRRAEQISRLEEKDFELDNRAQKAQGNIKSIQPQDSQAAEHAQKEKLKLMKMIYDSQQRQESLQEAISGSQKNTPLLPAAIGGLSDQGEDPQLLQMELELKALEQNYLQLKDLMAQMSKKAQTARMTVSQRIEGEKLQGNIDDLTRQGTVLKADLDDLRSQMIDLDKRKSYLETMIKQSP